MIPKRQLLAQKRNMMYRYRSLRSVYPFFCTAHPSNQPRNPMLYNAFHSARHPKSAPSPCNTSSLDPPSTPHVIHVPSTNLNQHLELHLNRFSHFYTAHSRESIYFATCIKIQLTCNVKPESPAKGLRSLPPACTSSLIVGSSKAP